MVDTQLLEMGARLSDFAISAQDASTAITAATVALRLVPASDRDDTPDWPEEQTTVSAPSPAAPAPAAAGGKKPAAAPVPAVTEPVTKNLTPITQPEWRWVGLAQVRRCL